MATTTPPKHDDNLKTKAQDAASNMTDKARQAAETATSKVRDAASNVADKAKDAASNLGQRAEDATHAMGSSMESLADTVREKMPQKGVLGNAASSVASGLETTGHYLQEEGLKGMANDMTDLIRRHPFPALLIGIGLGYIIARATTRS